jgi:uncharacterized protein (TIGR02611 family)
MYNLRRHSKRVVIGIIGGVVVLAGLVMIPYPGPGWLVVFSGLAILATEFHFAVRTLEFAKGKYDQWAVWLKQQNWFVRILILIATGMVIVVSLWVFNAFGIMNSFLSLNNDWLNSPLIRLWP